MPNGLITPGLVLEVAEATEDYVITQEEFLGLMETLMLVVTGIFAFSIITMLLSSITKGLEKGGK